VATVFVFGLKRGVGAETIREFFGCLHLDAHVGCSPIDIQEMFREASMPLCPLAQASHSSEP
jgi:hypothetical protein